jgi:hypothetical protein
MSCITVQLGQCGNQLGRVLNDTLFSHLASNSVKERNVGIDFEYKSNKLRCNQRSLERYFASSEDSNGTLHYHARSVLVDMETKVVQQCMKHTGNVFNEEFSSSDHSSSSNNNKMAHSRIRKPRTSRGARGGARKTTLKDPPTSSTKKSNSIPTWSYHPNSSFVRHSGSGNNWAAGYNTHGKGPKGAGAKVMELVRMEAERSDEGVSSLLLLQSLAGGTGSGVGARVSELLRDEYGNRSVIANALVAPYSAGEVSVQLYNSLLTLTHTAQSSDAVIIFQNDQIQSICRKRMRLNNPSFNDLNTVIAKHLASSILLPSKTWQKNGYDNGERGLEDAVRHLCSHPSYRMLGIKMIPFGASGDQKFDTSTWKGMLRRLHQMQMDPDAYMEDCIDWSLSSGTTKHRSDSASSLGSKGVNRTLAATLVLRGDDAASTMDVTGSSGKKNGNNNIGNSQSSNSSGSSKKNTNYTSGEPTSQEMFRYPPNNWIDTPGMFMTHLHRNGGHSLESSLSSSYSSVLDIRIDQNSFDQWERSASIVSNSQAIVAPFRRILTNATEMFEANAYIHQYETHGFQKDDINEAFEQMTQIVYDYSSL